VKVVQGNLRRKGELPLLPLPPSSSPIGIQSKQGVDVSAVHTIDIYTQETALFYLFWQVKSGLVSI
jgi:hypothetical protein